MPRKVRSAVTGRRKFLATAAAVTSVGYAGCLGGDNGDDDADDDTITLGGIHHLSGAQAAVGSIAELATETRVNHINEQGGIGGREIEYIALDGQTDADAVTEAAETLADAGALGVISPIGTPFVRSALSVLERERVPLLQAYGSVLPEVVDDYDNSWRIITGASGYAEAGVGFLETVVPDVDDVAQTGTFAWDADVIAEIEAEETGRNIVFDEYFAEGASDLSTHVREIRDSGAEAVTFMSGGGDALTLFRAMESLDYSPAICGRAGGMYPEVPEGLGEQVVGICGSDYAPLTRDFEQLGTPEWLDYWEEYNEDVTPTYLHTLPDLAILTMAEAIESILDAGEELTPQNMNAHMPDVFIEDHPFGGIEFDDRGQNVRDAMMVKQWQMTDDGPHNEIVWPDEFATADPIEHPDWDDK